MRFRWLVLALLPIILPPGLSSARADSAPTIMRLRVLPATLTLENARDARRLTVSGMTAGGYWTDLTDRAKFDSARPIVKRDSDGFFVPAKSGQTSLTVSAGGRSVVVPVNVKSVANPPMSFVREVMPVLSRSGCNVGTCHGSVKGKNGFKLSLRGFDPEFDYHALINDLGGRRFNRTRPAESLMLTKPTQEAAHQGGLVFEPDHRFYKTLHRWISEGVTSDVGKVQRANRIEVLPKTPVMSLPGETQRLIVIAHYPDGTSRDVTRDAVFSSTMKDVATVTEEGTVEGVRRGETAVLVRYEGNYAANEVTVIGDRSGYQWVQQPQFNFIDKHVDAKLKRIKAVSSGLSSDAEFIRRVYLDITGVIPSTDDVRAFVGDKSPTRLKRAKLIDQLLDSADYVNNWTNKWADMLQVNRKYLGERGVWKFRAWIQDQIAQNRPYNEFVNDIMTASGSTLEHPAGSYFRVGRDPEVLTENVTQLFLGIRFSCNKCHDHPFERWTQRQYYEFAANFARIGRKPATLPGDELISELTSGEVKHPKTNQTVTADFPYALSANLPKGDRRERLSAWLTSPKNPFFAKSYANRMWSYFLGRGIIDPVDDIRSSNPASNRELLEGLTEEFIKSKFDTKQLIRTICNSRTYQQSVKANKWNADDKLNFSHAYPRRLNAEHLLDSISRATGSFQKYPGVPAGFRAVQLPDSTVASGGFLDLFGRPPRESPCECERSDTVSLIQALNLVNGDITNRSVADPNGRIAKLFKTNPTDKQVIEELYLAAWSRYPTESEAKKALPLLAITPNRISERLGQEADKGDTEMTEGEAKETMRREAAQDLLWGLITSPAFLFNR